MIISAAYAIIVCLLATSQAAAAEGVIGVNWGRVSVHRLIPSMVVDLLLQNGVQHARIYTSEADILRAFSGSGINLTIGIYSVYAIKNDDDARAWVQKIVQFYLPANIRRVYIGNYVFKYGFNDQSFRDAGVNTLTRVTNALYGAGYGDLIKVSMPHTSIVLKGNITRPSKAEFKDEIMADMKKVLAVLQQSNAPFVVEIFPAVYVHENNMDPTFAFPDNQSTLVIKDVNGAVYTNAFDFVYDSFVWALEKAGAGNLEVVVCHVSWPTDGYPGASAAAAERFFKSLLPMVSSDKGTPKRPGRPIETYVHSLTDETKLPEWEPYGRHSGFYRANGEPKYKIDLTGRGRDIYPASAKGIMRMPDRWCMFKGHEVDVKTVEWQVKEACKTADCTTLAPGGSCSHLNATEQVSYMFNMYFQSQFQDERACDFGGWGNVVTTDPSRGECVFPVDVVRGQQKDFNQLAADGNGKISASSDGKRTRRVPQCVIFVLSLSIMWEMFWN